MYFDRTVSLKLEQILSDQRKMNWLVEYVRNTDDLDLHIGANDSKEWVSIYRGLSRIFQIAMSLHAGNITIRAAKQYEDFASSQGLNLFNLESIEELYPLEEQFLKYHLLIKQKASQPKSSLHRYYDNQKEGFWQTRIMKHPNLTANNLGIVIIDRESVIGYQDKAEKDTIFGRMLSINEGKSKISKINAVRYGKNIGNRALGNELDALAIGTDGNVHLLEIKDGANPRGIYLSVFQIGVYLKLFKELMDSGYNLREKLMKMYAQRKQLGLLRSDQPVSLSEEMNFIPHVIIGGFKPRSKAMTKAYEVNEYAFRTHPDWKGIYYWIYDPESGMKRLDLDDYSSHAKLI